MIKSVSKFISTLSAGIIIGMLGTVYLMIDKPFKMDPSQVRVDNVSGNKLSIVDVFRTKKSTVIDTKTDGAGENRITIPNTFYKYSAFGALTTDKSILFGMGYNVTDRISVLGGVWFRSALTYSGGVWVGGMYQF